MPKMHSDQFFFTLSDFKRLYQKNKSSYIKIAGACFCITLAWKAMQPPVFKAEAKYKKSAQTQEVSSSLKNFLNFLPLAPTHHNVASTMKSKAFLKLVAEDLGLQVRVTEKGVIASAFSNMGRNILAELGKKSSRVESFSFVNVKYLGSEPLPLQLRFMEGGEFEVLDHEGEIKARSRIGSAVVLKEASFIVEKAPKNVLLRKPYKIQIRPWEEVVENLQKSFFVKDDKNDTQQLHLTYTSSKQALSSHFLNYIMQKYTDFIKKENNEATQEHLTFLEERRRELENSYSKFLEEHANYLEGSLQKEGFMGLRQEMEILEKPNEDYHTKLYEVELELNRLKPLSKRTKEQKIADRNEKPSNSASTKKEELATAEKNERNEMPSSFSLILQEKLNAYLKNKSLDKEYARLEILAFANNFLKEDINALQAYKQETLQLINLLDQRPAQFENAKGDFTPNSLLASWVGQLKDEEKKYPAVLEENKIAFRKQIETKKDNLKGLLNDFLFLIEEKQESLLDQQITDVGCSVELQGLNPETAQQLYLEYNHELDAVQLNIKQLVYLKDQIFDPNVELSSLCNLLTDPISQQMIKKAGEMSLDLRDDQNRSLKEHERLKDSLSTQKRFILHHIAQMIDMQKMRARLIEEKIQSLQQSSVYLLSTEKSLIEERLADLRKKMSNSLPKKWKMENLMQLKKDLYQNMIEGIAQLEESKRVDQNILPSGFKVIDAALVPKKAESPQLFIFPFLIAFFAMMVKYVYDFFRRASKGSPISSELLKHYQFHSCGEISTYADAPMGELKEPDLETLRRISHFAYLQKSSTEGLCLTLLGTGNTNYSTNLAELLAQRGSNVLLIDSTFSGLSSSQSTQGLLAYLKGDVEKPLIRTMRSYDFIYSGGYSRNFVELLSQKKLQKFISDRKKEYDFVVIHTHASSTSVEALLYQALSDVCVVAAGFEDSIEDLESLVEWKESKKRDCLTFVLREG